ncbi:MAG: hypothetical protein WC027_02230 [Candidatus Paceibacterota bacterium]
MTNFNIKGFIIGLVTFLVLVIVFQAGVFVGFRKADFSQRLGENYGRIFGDDKGMPFDNMPGGHGAVGKVIKVSSTTIAVAEPNNIEKVILFGEDTSVRKARAEIKISDILVGDFVSVIGEANDRGEIEAKLVRILPPPPIQDFR